MICPPEEKSTVVCGFAKLTLLNTLNGTTFPSATGLWPRLFWVDCITNSDWRGLQLDFLRGQWGR